MTTGLRPVIVFDLDGTVLDSAPGIVSTMQRAMVEVGVEPADAALLRSDLGPPPRVILGQVGVPDDLIDDAVAAYRRLYLINGLQDACVYPGVQDLLVRLAGDHLLATATMKHVETATAFLTHHGLHHHFSLVGGASETISDKAGIIAATRERLGNPPPEQMIMVGDRHSDITGGRVNGMRTVAVSWGYGSRDELLASEPDELIDSPAELVDSLARLLPG